MFSVSISPDAKSMLSAHLKSCDFPRPGVVIHRIGPDADVVRSAEGKAVWSIGHRHPWGLGITSLEAYPDEELVVVDGIRVHLAIIPRPNETGVVIKVKDGSLFVEAVGA